MSGDEARAVRDTDLERERARYGLLAVVVSNLAITGVAIFGVWRLSSDRAVIVGVLTSAFTAMTSLTTAYLGIKAVSNTARSMAQDADRHRERTRESAAGAEPTPAGTPASAPPASVPAPAPPASPSAPTPAPASASASPSVSPTTTAAANTPADGGPPAQRSR
ncbi:hypothetical protein [Streptomyces sp. NPDC005423]|uniref:hypothetical protein n=1 Tax=Streptomyces sp. NPDC005423 TaxID=3155343 RepID=UPI0033A9EE2F